MDIVPFGQYNRKEWVVIAPDGRTVTIGDPLGEQGFYKGTWKQKGSTPQPCIIKLYPDNNTGHEHFIRETVAQEFMYEKLGSSAPVRFSTEGFFGLLGDGKTLRPTGFLIFFPDPTMNRTEPLFAVRSAKEKRGVVIALMKAVALVHGSGVGNVSLDLKDLILLTPSISPRPPIVTFPQLYSSRTTYEILFTNFTAFCADPSAENLLDEIFQRIKRNMIHDMAAWFSVFRNPVLKKLETLKSARDLFSCFSDRQEEIPMAPALSKDYENLAKLIVNVVLSPDLLDTAQDASVFQKKLSANKAAFDAVHGNLFGILGTYLNRLYSLESGDPPSPAPNFVLRDVQLLLEKSALRPDTIKTGCPERLGNEFNLTNINKIDELLKAAKECVFSDDPVRVVMRVSTPKEEWEFTAIGLKDRSAGISRMGAEDVARAEREPVLVYTNPQNMYSDKDRRWIVARLVPLNKKDREFLQENKRLFSPKFDIGGGTPYMAGTIIFFRLIAK